MSAAFACDVLVVGLGPAGASAAAAAARTGARVVAIDRRRQAGLPVQCAEFAPLMLGAETPALRAAFRQGISAMTTFVANEAPLVSEAFRGAMIDRAAFDRALCDEAQSAGAILRFGVALERLDAAGRARLGEGSRIAARVVIGADGPRSRVGASVARINREILETRQFAAPLRRKSASTDIYLNGEFCGGYAWSFPKGGVANVGIGVEAEKRARLKPLLADLRRRLIAQGAIGEEILSWTGGPIPVGGPLAPSAALEGVAVLLAGDAAGLVNPITGAGIPAAVVSGELAGEAAARIAGGDADAGADYAEEIEARFGASLARARDRRAELQRAFRGGGKPTPEALRRGWIAFPQYWAA